MSVASPNDPLHGARVLFYVVSPLLGGAERQALHVARHLQGLGCEVHVWSCQDGEGAFREACRAEGFPWAVHRFRWPCRKSSLLRDGWRLRRALRRARPDVILPYTAWPNVGCGLVWRGSGARACLWGQRNVHGLSGHMLERIAFRQVSTVIANAVHELEYLRDLLGPTPATLHVVPNGSRLDVAQRTRADWRADLAIPAEAVVVTMLAHRRTVKNHTLLLQAWRHVVARTGPETSLPVLLLAGAPGDADPQVQQGLADLGPSARARLLGPVSDVAGLLAASDIGVLTSLHEGLPNALIEYMAAGLPVVASDIPGNREVLGHDPRQPLFPSGDPVALATRLQAFMDDPATRQDVGTRNRDRAARQFSVDAMCTATTAILRDALASSPRRRRPVS